MWRSDLGAAGLDEQLFALETADGIYNTFQLTPGVRRTARHANPSTNGPTRQRDRNSQMTTVLSIDPSMQHLVQLSRLGMMSSGPTTGPAVGSAARNRRTARSMSFAVVSLAFEAAL